MIRVRLRIGAGSVVDTQNYGLVYISSDHRFAADFKDMDTTTYPEEEGEHVIPKVVDAPFDYTVKFYINAEARDWQGSLISNANQKIADFNAMLYTTSNGVRTLKKVYFYNDYKKTLIVGYPKPIAEATDFWRDSSGKAHDVVVVEWTIRVTKPSECNFNYTGM